MTLGHPLDRPVWSSLTSRQAALAEGNAWAVRLAPEPFPGGVDTVEDLERVRALLGS